MKRFAFLLALLSAQSARADMDACYRATCRVHAQGGAGTGCVYAKDDASYYILTNAHVAGTKPGADMTCVFIHAGHEVSVRGQVAWGNMSNGGETDQAVITVPVNAFRSFAPAIIPIAPAGTQLQNGQSIMSVGCPRATWHSLWNGHITTLNGFTMDFLPNAAPGRSGSAIFDETGSQIIGLVTWHTETGGRAQSLDGLYRGLGWAKPALEQEPNPYRLVDVDRSQWMQAGPPDDCPDCQRGRRPPMQPNQRPPSYPGDDDGQFNPAPQPNRPGNPAPGQPGITQPPVQRPPQTLPDTPNNPAQSEIEEIKRKNADILEYLDRQKKAWDEHGTLCDKQLKQLDQWKKENEEFWKNQDAKREVIDAEHEKKLAEIEEKYKNAPAPCQCDKDTPGMTELLAKIDARLTVIEQRKCESGPPGPAGKDGKDGAPGKDAPIPKPIEPAAGGKSPKLYYDIVPRKK